MRWLWDELTDAERRVALLAIRGLKDSAIANELNISGTRVTQHLTAVYRLFGVGGRVELAFLAGRHWEEVEAVGNKRRTA